MADALIVLASLLGQVEQLGADLFSCRLIVLCQLERTSEVSLSLVKVVTSHVGLCSPEMGLHGCGINLEGLQETKW